MKTANSRKKLLILTTALAMVVISIALCISAFAADTSNNVFTFGSDEVKNPLLIKNHFTELPRTFEAEVKFPQAASAYTSANPIIANYPNNTSRDSFGLQINKDGYVEIYYYASGYDAANSEVLTTRVSAIFNSYDVPGGEWVRLTAVCETESGKAVYKLYVNGTLVQTRNGYEKDDKVEYNDIIEIDPIYSQASTRELSIGCDGQNRFKGEIRNVAVYADAVSAADAAKPAKEHMTAKNSNLMAYYDATMSGNSSTCIKDQTGKGHDATIAFFERKTELKDYAYSFAFVGDIQFLVDKDTDGNTTKYTSPIFDWIVANEDSKNIKYVLGLGDITEDNEDTEWTYALQLHDKLEAAEIPYAVIAGNHDDYKDHIKYNNTFGKETYFTNSIDGYYQNGRVENYYAKFEVGTHKYMIVALQYGAPDDVLAWANDVVEANADRRVIVITHGLFDDKGDFTVADTRFQSSTSVKTLNNGIDMWNEFISRHENIIIAAGGHVAPSNMKYKTYTGVNGNTVHGFLIDPQGLDKSCNYDTGMVAMFYFSEDGSDVQVEYISATKTLAAQKTDSSAKDILYHEANQLSFKLPSVQQEGMTSTAYGDIPTDVYNSNVFAVFTDGEFISAHNTWKTVCTAAADIFLANHYADVQILLLKDYANTDDDPNNDAMSYAYGKLTVDLGKNTLTRGTNLFNLNIGADIADTGVANIYVKNGTVRTSGGPIVDNQLSNYAYVADKIWNITFDDVTFGLTSTLKSQNQLFYSAWIVNKPTSTFKAKTNLTLNNCTLDLKTNIDKTTTEEPIVLFKLDDSKAGVSQIDVTVKINGGKILADVDLLKAKTTPPEGDPSDLLVWYTANEGDDSLTFGANDKGEYTKLVTHTTTKDYAHYASALPADDGERYFVEISDNGTQSVYELQSLNYTYELLTGGTKTGTLSLGEDNVDAKYLSAVDYPFVLFDQKGNFKKVSDVFLSALSSAVNVTNSNNKPNGNTGYLLMRADYTMTKDEKFDNMSFARESGVVVDMRGYSIIADSTRSNQIFDMVVKQWSGSGDGIYAFPTKYVIKNGTFKTYKAYVISTKLSNYTTADGHIDITKKSVSFTFNNVNFELLPGSTLNRFFHIQNAASKDKSGDPFIAPIEFNLKDCTFDFREVAPSSTFYIIRANYAANNKDAYAGFKATVNINGGKVLANNLNNLDLIHFLNEIDGSALYFGKGSDGKYLSVQVSSGASIASFKAEIAETVISAKNPSGNSLVFKKTSSTETTDVYELVIKEAQNVSFSTKASITLDSNLIFNVYIPVSSALRGATLDGKAVVLQDPVDEYYVASVELSADEAARDIVLVVSLEVDGKPLSGTFTYSTVKYAKKLLAMEISNEERSLALDMLAYINSASLYFNGESITEITSILDGYTSSTIINVSNAKEKTDGLKGAAFVPNAKPSVQFHFADGYSYESFTFKIGGRTLTEKDIVYRDATYVEFSLYAHEMTKDFTYTVGGKSGEYNLISYFAYISGGAEDDYKEADKLELTDLVTKFYNYCASAKAYREYVIANQQS